MDEEKKIMEKRSSFRGWKERNKGKTNKKINAIGIVIILSILFALSTYFYLYKMDGGMEGNEGNSSVNSSDTEKNKTLSASTNTTPIKNIKNIKKTNKSDTTSGVTKKNIVGKIGVPLISSGFEITLKSVTWTEVRTNAWISVRNIEDREKSFKLGPGTVIIDNAGQQYENVKVSRSAEISQTNLSAQAMREGAVFFERLKEGRTPKKLTLNIINEKVEFMLNNSV